MTTALPSKRTLLLRAAVSAAALTVLHLPHDADATSIELNPVTPLGDVSILDHRNPAYGGRPSLDMVVPQVSDDPTLSRAEVLAETHTNGSSSSGSLDDLGDSTRKLEATSADLQRLESHFQVPMVVNLAVIQQKYGKSDKNPSPWPSGYWPTYQDSINVKWNGIDASPAEKYALSNGLNVPQFMDQVSRINGIDSMAASSRACTSDSTCTKFNDGSVCAKRTGLSSGYCIPTWYGICHAWAPAAILEDEPRCNVVKNGVTFTPLDIKALLTAVYDGASIPVVFTGARYNGAGSFRDEYGRFTDPMERDLGPGFFHIAVTNIMGRFGQSFVVDVNADAQVWNQPVRGYEIQETNVMAPDAAALAYFNVAKYPFNEAVKSVAYVHMVFRYINELVQDGPLVSTGIVDKVTVKRDYHYLLELDAQQNIIGGEWLFGSQTNHPDFLWFAKQKPAINTVTEVGLSYQKVVDLLKLSVACVTPTPTTPRPTTPTPTTPTPTIPPTSTPQVCGQPEVGVDYYGDDLRNVQALSPSECCAKCAATTGCRASTYVRTTSVCYLKTGTGSRRAAATGVVSSVVLNPLPSTCSTALYGSCGSFLLGGAKCCPTGSYCQPWNAVVSLCMPTPAKCTRQFPNVDLYGDDLATVYGIGPSACCDKCASTTGCKAYTYVSDNVPTSACYLKKNASQHQRTHASAVSGLLN